MDTLYIVYHKQYRHNEYKHIREKPVPISGTWGWSWLKTNCRCFCREAPSSPLPPELMSSWYIQMSSCDIQMSSWHMNEFVTYIWVRDIHIAVAFVEKLHHLLHHLNWKVVSIWISSWHIDAFVIYKKIAVAFVRGSIISSTTWIDKFVAYR